MVVDDIISNVLLLEGRLTGMGFDVVMASSGLECLNKLSEEKPDMILLDVMMPEMDGTEVCRRIKANPDTAGVPVILVTALSQELADSAAITSGADGCLVKPIGDEALRSCLERFAKEL
jgi:two-component system cell cycle response regulator